MRQGNEAHAPTKPIVIALSVMAAIVLFALLTLAILFSPEVQTRLFGPGL